MKSVLKAKLTDAPYSTDSTKDIAEEIRNKLKGKQLAANAASICHLCSFPNHPVSLVQLGNPFCVSLSVCVSLSLSLSAQFAAIQVHGAGCDWRTKGGRCSVSEA